MSAKGHAVATDQTSTGAGTPDDQTPAGGEGGAPGIPRGGEQDTEPKTYDEAYVTRLRDEAATNRVRAKRAEDAESRLRSLAIADATRGVLTDPTDLAWSEDMADDDGWPDADMIREAAEQLVEAKPHLGRPAGDVGQGRHSDDEATVNLAELLKAGA